MKNNYKQRMYQEIHDSKTEKKDLVIIFFLMLIPAVITSLLVDYSLVNDKGYIWIGRTLMIICECIIWVKWSWIYAEGTWITLYKIYYKYINAAIGLIMIIASIWIWIGDNF